MLIPITRAPGIMTHPFLRSLAPSVTSLCSHLPDLRRAKKIDAPVTGMGTDPTPIPKTTGACRFYSSARSTYPATVTHQILGLVGLRNTEKIVGPSVLRFLMSRYFSSSITKTPGSAPTCSPEPYASTIKSLEPEFQKAGLIKIYENHDNVIFSAGSNQAIRLFIDGARQPATGPYLELDFRDKYGNVCELHELMERFEPETYSKNLAALVQVAREHRLYRKDTPEAACEKGTRIFVLLMFRQVLRFLESHKKALSDLPPHTSSASPKYLREPYGAVLKILEPAFLKAGLIKVFEDNETVKFSIGQNQFFRLALLPGTPPAISLGFVGDKFNLHCISDLMKQIEPLAFKKRLSDLNVIIQHYGLADDYTPDTIRDEGVRIYLLTIIRQAMHFLESNKQALAALNPAEISTSRRPVRDPYGSAIDFWEPQRLVAGSKLAEPCRSVIELLEPELLKGGFKRIAETRHCVRFSFGTNQFFEILTGLNNVSSIAAFYLDQYGNQAYISHLMKKFEPATFEKNIADQSALRKKYRLDDKYTPAAIRDEGIRIYLTLILRQIINFLGSNKNALADKPHLL